MKTQRIQMTCENAQSLMFEYLDNALSEFQKKLFLNHIEGCAICQTELEKCKQMLSLIQSVDMEVPPTLHENVMKQIEDIPQDAKILGNKKRFIPWGTIAAACAVVMIMIAGRVGVGIEQNDADIVAERSLDRLEFFAPAEAVGENVYAVKDPLSAENHQEALEEDEHVIVETTTAVTMFSAAVKDNEGIYSPNSTDSVKISALDNFLLWVLTEKQDEAILLLYADDMKGITPESESESFEHNGFKVTRYTIDSAAEDTFAGYIKLFEEKKIDYRTVIPTGAEFERCEIWLLDDGKNVE